MARHEPWIFLSLVLLVSFATLYFFPTSTGKAVLPTNTLAYPPRVIDHRDAWTPSSLDRPASAVQGDLVYVRNGYYVFEDGRYVTDRNGNTIAVPTNSMTGGVVYPPTNQAQVMRARYAPIYETCRDSDQTRTDILNERPDNSYFQPGLLTMDLRKQVLLGEAILSEEIIPGVAIQDRCYSAVELGYTNLPDYRGVVLEASCAHLRGLKNAYLTQAVMRSLGEDTQLSGDLSWLSRLYTAQFCQKSTPVVTSGSTQNIIQYVACGRTGEQGYCQ